MKEALEIKAKVCKALREAGKSDLIQDFRDLSATADLEQLKKLEKTYLDLCGSGYSSQNTTEEDADESYRQKGDPKEGGC